MRSDIDGAMVPCKITSLGDGKRAVTVRENKRKSAAVKKAHVCNGKLERKDASGQISPTDAPGHRFHFEENDMSISIQR